MAHKINLARTPAHLQTPYYQRMLTEAPACTPRSVPAWQHHLLFREPLTEGEIAHVLEPLGR